MPCIMPEQPYCPACEFGRIVQTEDMPDTDCSWECICTQEKYCEYLLHKLEAQANTKEGRGNLMAVYEPNKSGYIVFEDGGTCPLAYGATEKWFATYDEAIAYAMDTVRKRVDEFKRFIDCNSVIVYEGEEELMHISHAIPYGRIVFKWSNY